MTLIKATTDEQIQELMDWALAGDHALTIQGRGTKQSIGQPVRTPTTLDLSGLEGVEIYEPAELVMKAKAGTCLSEIQSILRQSGQDLAFDPPDFGPLLGTEAGQGTLGGLFSGNLSGSRRVKAGAARDHLLGVQGFTGRGQVFQTGSRVMKNVTGYDLCKLVAGSYGTLAIATSLTFKVLPQPEKTRTVLVFGLDLAQSVAVMREGISSVHDVSSAAYLPAEIASQCNVDYVAEMRTSVAAFRIEGPGPSAEFRCQAVRNLLNDHGDIEELHGHNSIKFWKYVGDASAFVGTENPVWKLSVPPKSAPEILSKILNSEAMAEYYLDWAGGLIWLQMPDNLSDGGAKIIRGAIGDNGHATLIRGREELRTCIDVFHPPSSAVEKISRRIKEGFDPQNILNPGRMYRIEERQVNN